MIWWLLTLYPAIGLGLGIYYGPKLQKIDPGTLGENTLFYLMMPLIGPFIWRMCATECREGVAKAREAEEREHEKLLESVRQERLAPDPRLAEFDILLGIEPVEREAIRIPVTEYDQRVARALGGPMEYARGGYVEDFRLCDVAEFRVRDIILPPEYRGVDIQSKVG